jgi:hypothetical protein
VPEKVALRVNGIYWKERSVVVQKQLHTGSPPR